jgi:diguanylate cyclase (GGDEF)-like protein
MTSPLAQPKPLAPAVAPRPAVSGRLLPFALPAVLGLALLAGPLTPPGQAPLWTACGVALAVAAGLAAAFLPWGRWQPWLNDFPPLGFATGVLLLRYGVSQPAWNVSPLLLLPAFWLALYGRPWGLMALLALLAVAGLVPDFFLPRTEALSPPVVLGFVTLGALFLTVQRLFREQQRRTISLQQQLRLDPLTGAGNRTAWDEALTRELARARRTQDPICLAVIDLDHFKRVNDQFGHAAGDALLRACVQGWQEALRPGDPLARMGGEEFAVLLPACSVAEALTVVERLRAAVPGKATCSAGLAQWDGQESPAQWLERADAALYRAKEQGRDRCVLG